MLTSRIGLDLFKSRVQRLKESKAYNHSDSTICDENEIIFDASFLEFLREHLGNFNSLDYIIKALTIQNTKSGTAKVKDQTVLDQETILKLKSQLEEANTMIHDKDEQIVNLKACVEELKAQLSACQVAKEEPPLSPTKITDTNTNQNLSQKYMDLEEKFKALEMDQEDLLLCLADQELEIQEFKDRLIGYGETFDDEEQEL